MFGAMVTLAPFVFAFSICLVVFALVQFIFKKTRKKGKRNFLVGVVLFVSSVPMALVGSANIYRDYGVESPEQLPAKMAELHAEQLKIEAERAVEQKKIDAAKAEQELLDAAIRQQEEEARRKEEEIHKEEESIRRQAEQEKKLEADCSDVSLLYIVSQKRVRDRLLSPSGAEFPWQVVGWEKLPDCSIRLLSYVDAPNAFGVKLRKHYFLVGKWVPENNAWSLVSIDFVDN